MCFPNKRTRNTALFFIHIFKEILESCDATKVKFCSVRAEQPLKLRCVVTENKRIG